MLSEVDLLTLMEKNGIGTDATQAQHIEKVVGERGYAKKVGENRLVPTNIGEALVAGYDFLQLGFMWQPTKRAEMEKDVRQHSQGFHNKRRRHTKKYRANDSCVHEVRKQRRRFNTNRQTVRRARETCQRVEEQYGGALRETYLRMKRILTKTCSITFFNNAIPPLS